MLYSNRVIQKSIFRESWYFAGQMTLVNSFKYLAKPDAAVLILGSMPGVASLQQQEYYAHPRNVFWDFMEQLFAISRTLPYRQRIRQLQHHRVALWDVAQQCKRQGSLDSNIKNDSVVPNDIVTLFESCSRIHTVFFNGKKADEMFRKLVFPKLEQEFRALDYCVLPSTSPANASLSRDEKFQCWLAVKQILTP